MSCAPALEDVRCRNLTSAMNELGLLSDANTTRTRCPCVLRRRGQLATQTAMTSCSLGQKDYLPINMSIAFVLAVTLQTMNYGSFVISNEEVAAAQIPAFSVVTGVHAQDDESAAGTPRSTISARP